MIIKVFEIWKASTENLPKDKSFSWGMGLQGIPALFLKHSDSNGMNVLGLKPEEAPLVLMSLEAAWENPELDSLVIGAGKKLISDIDTATRSAGMFHPFKYLNYAAAWQEPIESYGEENVSFLRHVSRKYDPSSVFQLRCPGGFKIPMASRTQSPNL
jgi:hypothetical protein